MVYYGILGVFDVRAGWRGELFDTRRRVSASARGDIREPLLSVRHIHVSREQAQAHGRYLHSINECLLTGTCLGKGRANVVNPRP